MKFVKALLSLLVLLLFVGGAALGVAGSGFRMKSRKPGRRHKNMSLSWRQAKPFLASRYDWNRKA